MTQPLTVKIAKRHVTTREIVFRVCSGLIIFIIGIELPSTAYRLHGRIPLHV